MPCFLFLLSSGHSISATVIDRRYINTGSA
jgi:hypothetical protein